jgi:hypothetical protein
VITQISNCWLPLK